MDIEESFVSGFCKAQNQTRMVICEFEKSQTEPEYFWIRTVPTGVVPTAETVC